MSNHLNNIVILLHIDVTMIFKNQLTSDYSL